MGPGPVTIFWKEVWMFHQIAAVAQPTCMAAEIARQAEEAC